MKNFFYVEKLLCEFSIDHFFSNNASCHARPMSRDVVVVNFYGMLRKEIRDLSVLFQNPFKMDRNEWTNFRFVLLITGDFMRFTKKEWSIWRWIFVRDSETRWWNSILFSNSISKLWKRIPNTFISAQWRF